MSHHARIEEVSDSDSDPEVMDPSAFDPRPSLLDPSHVPSAAAVANAPQTGYISHTESDKYKGFQCLYPVYFDRTRSRAEGRRVGAEMAVLNPLARDIVDATQELGLRVVFEPGKMHPKDWANPGRVRVLIKVNGKAVNPRVKNKRHLYSLVSKHLLANPTTPESPLRLRLPNVPMPDPNKPLPPVAIPRGWKMGTILPIHSAALSGGGVSENFFKEMMGELQGQVEGTSGGGESGSGGKKKKEKKKVKA